jgi:VWFA-related protein
MTRAIAPALLAIVALSASGQPQDSQTRPAQQPTFRSTTAAVPVEVSVRNGTKVVTGLVAKDFIVTDNGVPQEIYQASYGKLPIDVTVELDTSFSVTGSLIDRLRRAIAQMMSDMSPADRLKLITFNMQVSRVVDFTNDVNAVESAIRETAAGGATSVFDALSVALVAADHPDRRQLVVLFTDGQDTMSITDSRQIVDVAERSNATLTAVLPVALTVPTRGSPFVFRLSPLQRQEGQLYARLATETGGMVIPIVANENLTSTFQRALDEFRSSYVLYFTPQGVDRGGYHTLTVSVPQNKSYTVRTRKGYWGE